MPFGIIGRTAPGMRHVVGLGIGPREGVLLGRNLGPAIVTDGVLLSQRRGHLPKLLWADLFVITGESSQVHCSDTNKKLSCDT